MKFSIIILAFIIFTSCQTVGQKKNENHTNLTSKIDSIIVHNGFNGVVLLTKDSTIIYSKTIGYSDLEKKTPMTLNDQFVIGSISKQITAVLVLREYEKGKIRLEDTINQYLTEINQPWAREVTIHHLLTHTHGIVNLLEPLEFKQGSQFHYSQLGYELLAQILQKITGQTFENLSTELFQKYGLTNTFHPNSKKYKNLVKGYVENENGTLVFATNSLYNYVPAGGFISNTIDLKKWNEKLHSGNLVKKETLELMSTNYATRIHPIFDTIAYGYGLLFKDGKQNIQIGALGYAPGFVSACYHYPQTNMNLIVLENTAKNLNDFNQTFKVHTELMNLIKKYKPNIKKNKKAHNSVQKIQSKELQRILDSSKVNGTLLIFDYQEKKYYSNDFREAEKSVIPASTYKIPNSIIGLESGILENEKTIFKWDGKERSFSFWEKDLDLKEAFQRSCVPCYQELARKIGTKRMNQYLKKLNFGEMDVNNETIDNFWLIGQSKINPFQQINFLKRLHNKELPISKSTTETIINILKIEENENFVLSGKTGLAINSTESSIGWFVGYLEIEKNIFYFATRISPNRKDMPINEFSSIRKSITISALKKMGILE